MHHDSCGPKKTQWFEKEAKVLALLMKPLTLFKDQYDLVLGFALQSQGCLNGL